MRILIIYPENQVAGKKPIAIPLLSAILKTKGHEIDFIDTSQFNQSDFFDKGITGNGSLGKPNYFMKTSNTSIKHRRFTTPIVDEINHRLMSFGPEVILVSGATIAFHHARKILSRIETDIPVIYGGYHTVGNSEEAISHPDINAICIGEGEEALVELLSKMEKGQHYYDTPNFYFKDKSGAIIKNPRLPLRDNLDDLPFLDYSIFDSNYHFWRVFRGRYYRMGDIAHSRGCYSRCSYCFYDKYYEIFDEKKNILRAYSPKRIVEEIEYLSKNYNLDFIRVHSSDFFAQSEDYLSEFSRLYKMKVGLPNAVNGLIPMITRSKARMLRQMGCVNVSIGIETGNEEYRRKILNKHFTNENVVKKVGYLLAEGIRVTTSNMIFLPEETREMIFENIKLHKKAKIELMDYNSFYPFPGLTITKYCKEKDLLTEEPSTDIVFGCESVLKGNYSKEEQIGLLRTIYLYKEFPRIMWGLVKVAESNSRKGDYIQNILHNAFHLYKYGLDFEQKRNFLVRKYRNFRDRTTHL